MFLGLSIVFAPRVGFAHVAEEKAPNQALEESSIHDTISAMIVEPDLFPANTPLTIWFEIKDTTSDTHLTNLKPTVSLKNPQGVTIDSAAAILKGDEYVYEYAFPAAGDYKLVLTFTHEGKEHQSSFTIPVSASASRSVVPQAIVWWIVGITGAAVAGIWIFGLVPKKKAINRSIVLSIVAVIVAGIVYSVVYTIRSGAATAGVVTCLDSGECFWTAHIHAYFPITICGKEYSLPVEKGALNGPHTHEERNISHWHDRLPYDKSSGKITKTDPLLVSSFFQGIEVSLTNATIADQNVGDTCNGQPATLKAFVNGKYTPDIINHIWQDKEVISIYFNARTPPEIEAELKTKPIEFPALGRG